MNVYQFLKTMFKCYIMKIFFLYIIYLCQLSGDTISRACLKYEFGTNMKLIMKYYFKVYKFVLFFIF